MSVEDFVASLPFDRRLYRQDILGSLAHLSMLTKSGIVSAEEAGRIKGGLAAVLKQMKDGGFPFDTRDEDIHMTIERALIEIVGPIGGKLHTARSRNDQIVLDLRLYLKSEIRTVGRKLLELQDALTKKATENISVIMPGYTHLQPAQPVLFAHHLMAYCFMIKRDFQRLRDCYRRTDTLPLGAAALAGTGFPINRDYLAQALGFGQISQNSMDTVADRDFVVEFLAAASLIMVHLSRLAEELIIWSTNEFGFVEIEESFTTGSSIMPQKRNPDVAELVRAKTGRVVGDLVQMLTILKGLPLAYNRDLQEDKEALFDAVDALKPSLEMSAGMIRTLKVDRDRLKKAVRQGFLTATDLADYLVGKGMPFREAHKVVKGLVRECLESGVDFAGVDITKLQKASSLFGSDALPLLDPARAVERRQSAGGTATARVKEQLDEVERGISEQQSWLDQLIVEPPLVKEPNNLDFS